MKCKVAIPLLIVAALLLSAFLPIGGRRPGWYTPTPTPAHHHPRYGGSAIYATRDPNQTPTIYPTATGQPYPAP